MKKLILIGALSISFSNTIHAATDGVKDAPAAEQASGLEEVLESIKTIIIDVCLKSANPLTATQDFIKGLEGDGAKDSALCWYAYYITGIHGIDILPPQACLSFLEKIRAENLGALASAVSSLKAFELKTQYLDQELSPDKTLEVLLPTLEHLPMNSPYFVLATYFIADAYDDLGNQEEAVCYFKRVWNADIFSEADESSTQYKRLAALALWRIGIARADADMIAEWEPRAREIPGDLAGMEGIPPSPPAA